MFYATNCGVYAYLATATGIRDLNQPHKMTSRSDVLRSPQKGTAVRVDKIKPTIYYLQETDFRYKGIHRLTVKA